jgi:hypothetical protein
MSANEYRTVKVFPWDICPGDVIVENHFQSAAVIGTVAVCDWPANGVSADGRYTGRYESGHTFRFRENQGVRIHTPYSR